MESTNKVTITGVATEGSRAQSDGAHAEAAAVGESKLGSAPAPYDLDDALADAVRDDAARKTAKAAPGAEEVG